MLKVRVKKEIGKDGDKFSVDVYFEVGEEILVIYGPSGSGKTSILKLISGLMEPDEGSVILNNKFLFESKKKINLPPYERKIGYVFQTPSLFPHLTIRENVLYGMQEKRKDLLEHLLKSLRLKGLEERYPHQISLGQQQRVSIARTLATSPQALLLDEPFSSLDERVREKLRLDLKRVQEERKIPTIFVTHALSEAYSLAHRIAVVNEGIIEQVGTPEEVYSKPLSKAVARFVGVKNIFEGTIVHKDLMKDETIISWQGYLLKSKYTRFPVGEKVVWMIRPENIIFRRTFGAKSSSKVRRTFGAKSSPKENLFMGRVVEVQSWGANFTLFIQVSEKDYDFEMLLPAHVGERYELKKGKRVEISLKKESIHLIPVSRGESEGLSTSFPQLKTLPDGG